MPSRNTRIELWFVPLKGKVKPPLKLMVALSSSFVAAVQLPSQLTVLAALSQA